MQAGQIFDGESRQTLSMNFHVGAIHFQRYSLVLIPQMFCA